MKPLALLSLVLLLVISAQAQQTLAADLILHNGVIYTVDRNSSTAEAVAIKDDKFIAVGSNASKMSCSTISKNLTNKTAHAIAASGWSMRRCSRPRTSNAWANSASLRKCSRSI